MQNKFIYLKYSWFLLGSIIAFTSVCFGQTSIAKTRSLPIKIIHNKTSPAYAEVLLHKTELESELEALLLDYTEEFPKVKELRFELSSVKKEMDKILAVKPEESSKLTLALGKLMVKKTQIETDLWSLQSQYKDDHPEVKRAKRKVEIYESAIKEVMN